MTSKERNFSEQINPQILFEVFLSQSSLEKKDNPSILTDYFLLWVATSIFKSITLQLSERSNETN